MKRWKGSLKKFLASHPVIEFIVRSSIFIVYVMWKYLGSLAMPSKTRVIAINHHYEQDIEAMRLGGSDIGIIDLKHNYIFGFANLYFRDADFRGAKIPYDSPDFAEAREKYRRFVRVIVAILKSLFRHKALLLPSDSFFWVREAVHVHREKSIPVIVIDKEGVIAPYYFREWIPIRKKNFPFMSDRLIVWSERQRDFWNQTGVDNDLITVIGQPRSDFFFHPERWASREKLGLPTEGKVVLFFTYEKSAYVPLKSVAEEKDWLPLRSETHEVLKEVASMNRDIRFIIKCHPQQRDLDRVYADFRGVKNAVVMTGSQSSNNLVVNSDLVICFQTTGFLDAHLIRKPIIYPAWGELFDELKENDMLPWHRSQGALFCPSPTEFKKELVRLIDSGIKEVDSEDILRKRQEFVGDWFYNPDGQVGSRVIDAVSGIIDSE